MPLSFLLVRRLRLPVDFDFLSFDFLARAIIHLLVAVRSLGAASRNPNRFDAALPAENCEHQQINEIP